MKPGIKTEKSEADKLVRKDDCMGAKIIPREVIGKPSTPRVDFRYKELISKEAYIDSERAVLYTDYIKEHWILSLIHI